jgi:DOPA 4,5-dioxygenase
MTEAAAEPVRIEGYHVHIYYDAKTRPQAAVLRTAIGDKFPVELGRFRDEPVGPHPEPMFQVKFAAEVFDALVPWLMLNRGGLDVLLHPLTDDAYADHSRHAAWLGAKLPLKLDGLRRSKQ